MELRISGLVLASTLRLIHFIWLCYSSHDYNPPNCLLLNHFISFIQGQIFKKFRQTAVRRAEKHGKQAIWYPNTVIILKSMAENTKQDLSKLLCLDTHLEAEKNLGLGYTLHTSENHVNLGQVTQLLGACFLIWENEVNNTTIQDCYKH